MKEAHEIVNKKVTNDKARGKVRYDRKASSIALKKGDRVLVRRLAAPGGANKSGIWIQTLIQT